MNTVLEEIHITHKVKDNNGNTYELHSEVSRGEGKAIQSVIKDNRFERTIEIGCAYGISSLHICEAIRDLPNPEHVAVDPLQSTEWNNIGVRNVEKAGYEFFRLIEGPSEIALPELMKTKKGHFDFALIDGKHTLDHTLLDFFYLNHLVKVGGIIAVDDLHMYSVNKAVRYVLNYPAYEVVANENLSDRGQTLKRRLIDAASGAIPDFLVGKVFDPSFVYSDADLGIHTSMVFLKKTEADKRAYDWFVPF